MHDKPALLLALALACTAASAENIGCVTTEWKLIDGAPANSLSSVPVMPWGGR